MKTQKDLKKESKGGEKQLVSGKRWGMEENAPAMPCMYLKQVKITGYWHD